MERLPEDIIMDIIARLPIKYILGCKCVCKSWEAILSTPLFATTHFNKSSSLDSITNYMISYHNSPSENLLYFVEDDKEAFTTVKEDTREAIGEDIEEEKKTFTISNVKPLNFPFLANCFAEYTRAIFMGACNGFLCFSSKDIRAGGGSKFDRSLCPTNPIYIFNPLSGEHILLPEFEETRLVNCAHGFGFDVSTQQYKVVLVYFLGNRNLMQVHTVGSDPSWRTYNFDSIPGVLKYVIETSLSLLFNGSLHWIVLNSIDDRGKSIFHSIGNEGIDEPKRAYILSFQLDTEELTITFMPEPLQVIKPYFRNSMDYALQICGGCFSIAYSPSRSVVEIWVMKNYGVKESWIKQYSIQLSGLESLTSSNDLLKLLGFRKNGELMLYLSKQLVSYNTENGGYKILKLDGELPSPTQVVPFPFVGSLISLRSAFGDKFADNKVIRTPEFGNPTQRQRLAVGFDFRGSNSEITMGLYKKLE